jgi:hypothetical protein
MLTLVFPDRNMCSPTKGGQISEHNIRHESDKPVNQYIGSLEHWIGEQTQLQLGLVGFVKRGGIL